MLDNKRLLVAVTALAITGVLGLLLYSATLGAVQVDIPDIGASHEGCELITTGTVTGASAFPGGSISLELSDLDTGTSIGVYVPPETATELGNITMAPGAVLRVQGVLSFYLDSPEITVSGVGGISVVSEPGSSGYTLDTVMNAIQLFDGLETTTSGRMTDMVVVTSSDGLVGTGFSLRDVIDNRTYSLECFCYDRDLTASSSEWDEVSVTGTVSYYRNNGCWQMSVEVVTPA